jgi:hypothetical protein
MKLSTFGKGTTPPFRKFGTEPEFEKIFAEKFSENGNRSFELGNSVLGAAERKERLKLRVFTASVFTSVNWLTRHDLPIASGNQMTMRSAAVAAVAVAAARWR